MEVKKISNIAFGTANLDWSQYGLEQTPILFGSIPNATNYKAIIRNNELVAILGKDYELLPNEEAVKVANKSAAAMGLIPFSEFEGEWFTRMDDHVIYNDAETKVHALYAINKPYFVGNDKFHVGVGVHNSIDGSMGFGAGVFTFRTACANMVFAGFKGYAQQFDRRKNLQFVYKRHTKGLKDVSKNLSAVLLNIMDAAKLIIERYREMERTKINLKLIKRLKKTKLPKNSLPEWINTKEELLEVPDITQFKLYNDITELIWHNTKTQIDQKRGHYAQLHKALPILRIR